MPTGPNPRDFRSAVSTGCPGARFTNVWFSFQRPRASPLSLVRRRGRLLVLPTSSAVNFFRTWCFRFLASSDVSCGFPRATSQPVLRFVVVERAAHPAPRAAPPVWLPIAPPAYGRLPCASRLDGRPTANPRSDRGRHATRVNADRGKTHPFGSRMLSVVRDDNAGSVTAYTTQTGHRRAMSRSCNRRPCSVQLHHLRYRARDSRATFPLAEPRMNNSARRFARLWALTRPSVGAMSAFRQGGPLPPSAVNATLQGLFALLIRVLYMFTLHGLYKQFRSLPTRVDRCPNRVGRSLFTTSPRS